MKEFLQEAKDLVAQMTLDERISTMMHEAPAIERLGLKAFTYRPLTLARDSKKEDGADLSLAFASPKNEDGYCGKHRLDRHNRMSVWHKIAN